MPHIQCILVLLLILPGIILSSEQSLTILATGETHAMLDACDCADTPSGGLPKRARLIKDLRKQRPVLLLDAGGFSGGGIYDFYTEGRSRDSVRTLLTMQAMARMQYDAVAIGDDELQYDAAWLKHHAEKEKLALVSANCRDASGTPIGRQYRIVKKGTVTFGITAVTTQEWLFPIDTSVIINDPVASIKKIWKKLVKESDYQIILSHLGEKQVAILLREFPECDIIVNGHRKMSVAPVISLDNQILMQFGFQGKYLSAVDYDMTKKMFHPQESEWITITDTMPDDTEILTLVNRYEKISLPHRNVFDLYLMSQCPYGIPALKDVLALSEQFPFIELSVWFIGDILENGTLKSLHGDKEIEEEKMWLALHHLFPDLWSHFLYLVAAEGMTTKGALTALGIDFSVLKTWMRANGTQVLTHHYYRSQRQNIEASPTLFINNQLEQHDVSYLRLAKVYCQGIPTKKRPGVCDSLPECFEDTDCRKTGKIGTCVIKEDKEGGTCSFSDAVIFDFITVIPDSPLVHSEQSAVATTRDLFPGARILTYTQSSKQGKKLIREVNPACLPLYLFTKQVKGAVNFDKIKSGIKETGKWVTFNDEVMKKHYFYKRKKITSGLTVYIDPFFPDIGNVLKELLQKFPDGKGITIKPVLFEEKISKQSSSETKLRHEEALRWCVLATLYDTKTFPAYLNAYQVQPGSSYWFSVLKELHVDIDAFVKKVKKNKALLKELWQELQQLGIGEPVELLWENREVVLVKNQRFLEELLSKLK